MQASAPQRVALPPPTYTSHAARFEPRIHPIATAPSAPSFTYDNQVPLFKGYLLLYPYVNLSYIFHILRTLETR